MVAIIIPHWPIVGIITIGPEGGKGGKGARAHIVVDSHGVSSSIISSLQMCELNQ